jgi:hypothetical protein
VLFAFDLLELDGKDLRRSPLEERKREHAKLLRKAKWALQLNEHIDEPGDVVFKHACKLGFEGIVSKRLGSPYRGGDQAFSGTHAIWLVRAGCGPAAMTRTVGPKSNGYVVHA